MNRTSTLALAALALAALAPRAARAEDAPTINPKVKMETSLGAITLELNGERAPVSTLNFVRYVEDGFYNGLIFHRVIAGFMIQGGGYTAALDEKTQGLHEPIKNEWKNALTNDRGTISMARTQVPDSATAQFFINVVDNAALDQPRGGAAYAVFGKVVEGLDIVDKIRYTPVKSDAKLPMGQVVPVEPIVIKSVALASKFDKAKCEEQAKKWDSLVAGWEKEIQAKQEKRMAEAKAKADEMKAKEPEMEKERVKKYEDANAKGTATPSGLKYLVVKAGTGESPLPTDQVKVHYTGWLTNGKKFDSSVDRGQPATFPLNRVIPAWTEGVGLMKKGGKSILICPGNIAYGERGAPPDIGPNATLVFEVELLDIVK